MTYLFIALVLYFGGILGCLALFVLGSSKSGLAGIWFMFFGWVVGVVAEVSALIFTIMWTASLFN